MELKKYLGIWIILLVVSLPVYSSSALAASVQITANHGTSNVNGFINANGDTWTVEATVSEASEVKSDDVFIKVGAIDQKFDSCTSGTAGYVCTYNSDLSSGVQEREFPFIVEYRAGGEVVSRGSVVKADGSAPVISGLTARQAADGKIDVNFYVEDRGAAPVGLKTIEILDADDNSVLQTIDGAAKRQEFSFQGVLSGITSGEGVRRIKVRAADLLGNAGVSSAVSFRVDFINAVIETVNFTDLGKFIGQSSIRSDLAVDVRETNLIQILASSAQTSLQNSLPTSRRCTQDAEDYKLWHCIWEDVLVQPQTSIILNFDTTDGSGNTGRSSRTVTFVKDDFAPEVEFFGTNRVYEGESFITSRDDNRVIIRLKEQGAGITKSGIKANLQALELTGIVEPTYFNETTLEGYWDVGSPAATSVARISLVELVDKVGNKAEVTPEPGIVVDRSGPLVERIELIGLGEDGEHDYLQSNDRLKVKFTVLEENGLIIFLDLNELVTGVELDYPAGGLTHALGSGWRVYTEDEGCTRLEGKWECEIETEAVMSGTGRLVDFEIKIEDTAGNEAVWSSLKSEAKNKVSGEKGDYQLQLLGLSTEENPDFWELAKNPLPLSSFVDLDATNLIPTRMPLKVDLKTKETQAKALGVSLANCIKGDENSPELKSSQLFSAIQPGGETNPSVNIFLEFDAFDGREFFRVGEEEKFTQAVGKYLCTLQVYTKIGSNAIQNPQLLPVELEVPFKFSSLGAMDENLAQQVYDLKENALFKFATALSYLATVFKFINFALRLFNTIIAVNQVIDLATTTLDINKAAIRTTQAAGADIWSLGTTKVIEAALTGQCLNLQFSTAPSWTFLQEIQKWVGLFSCNPTPTGEFGWYGKWQQAILSFYNLASGRGLLGVPASSLYENMYTAALGLCLPGIIYNVEKAREVYCRKIICYGREIPAGVATIESCNQLYSLQMCEFVLGPVFDFVGFGGIATLGKILESFFSSPLGFIALSEVIGCAFLCTSSFTPGEVSLCKVATGINKALTIVDNIVGAIQTIPSMTGQHYCSQIDDIDINELTGGKFLPKEESETEEAESPSGVRPNVPGGVRSRVDENQQVQQIDPRTGRPVGEQQ